MTKSELRKIYLAKQTGLSSAEKAKKCREITGLFFDHVDLGQIKILHCFIAIEKFNEIDTTFIFHRVWKDFPQMTTVVPRINFKAGEIENLKFTPVTELVKNVWEIHEPSHDEYVDTTNIDLVIVPLLCFDTAGHRVGYGKGYYDRFLGKCAPGCVKTGLSYFPPVSSIPEVRDHDIKLDFCVTPTTVYRFEKQKGG